ncbi:hypothetical protein C1645_838763 [Glomus cerebriforme]|uniref:Uncharacterized protein n=1 Tax=Glomus cerebriforme TaxID=658196 RepID=A0A397S1U6_9GLOM|nr:hypothetical protein C1645_838763 [Glomus cerebriforme]
MSNNRFNCHLHDYELINTPVPLLSRSLLLPPVLRINGLLVEDFDGLIQSLFALVKNGFLQNTKVLNTFSPSHSTSYPSIHYPFTPAVVLHHDVSDTIQPHHPVRRRLYNPPYIRLAYFSLHNDVNRLILAYSDCSLDDRLAICHKLRDIYELYNDTSAIRRNIDRFLHSIGDLPSHSGNPRFWAPDVCYLLD